MSAATGQIVAPTDAQLDFIASLCAERGWPPPEVVASKQEASEIIGAILAGSYDSGRYCYPYGWQEDVPF